MKTLFFILLVALGPIALSAPEKPNIVVILADDLGINDLSCYGRKDHPTPAIDQLARQGIRFTSAYCAQPICSPSRAALLTGKCPARLHLTNYLPGRPDAPSQKLLQPVIEGQLPLEEVTLAETLREAGYSTACIGKWHLGGEGFGPLEQGFDFAFAGRARTRPSESEGSKGEYELTTQAEQWIEAQKDHPFFLYLAQNSPHIPFEASEQDVKANAQALNPAYAAVIGHLDKCVGRMLAKLDALRLAEKTMVVFASDNGGLHVLEGGGSPSTLNTPYRAGKGFLYEGGVRVPLIVRWPGTVAPGTISDTPVLLADLMPTLLEAAGIDSAKAIGPLDGVSLVKTLGGDPLPARTLYWHFPHYTNQGSRPAGAMREGNWKLVEDYERSSAELYDLALDPGETLDLAAAEPERVTKMRSKLAAWRVSVGAQEMEPNPQFDFKKYKAIYVDRDVSRVNMILTAAEREWSGWREAMDSAVTLGSSKVTPPRGDIRLYASRATIHGEKLRYEPQPMKNTLGFWVRAEDWAGWDVNVPFAGKYELEIQQGCGNGNGGAEVSIEMAGQSHSFKVVETGHFQHFIRRKIGVFDLPGGPQALSVKPKSKPGGAVMDLREVVLRPIR